MTVLPLLLLPTLALAALNFSDWHPPSPGSVRSPCPALNSLANHGFINRSGQDLREEPLVTAMGEALNVSKEVATTVFNAGMRTSSDPSSGSFSLEDLTKHGIIEHDGSLSRKDKDTSGTPPDAFTFCEGVFDEFLSYFNGSNITVENAAKARWGRISTSRTNNPSFTYAPGDQFNSYVESSIYLELFRDPATQETNLDFVKIWFQQERLPFDEGWRPTNKIDGFSLMQDVLNLALFTPDDKPAMLGKREVLSFHARLL